MHPTPARRSPGSRESMRTAPRFQRSSPDHRVSVLLSLGDKSCSPSRVCNQRLMTILSRHCMFQQGKERALCQGLGNTCRTGRGSKKLGRMEYIKFQERMVCKLYH